MTSSLEQLYKDMENSPFPPTWVYFQGVKFRCGSKRLYAAIEKWKKRYEKTRG